MDINDGYLVKEVIKFCEKIEKKSLQGSDLKLSEAEQSTSIIFKHPLDSEVKKKLIILEEKLDFSNDDYPELLYTECTALDDLWNDLIEKSIMCLRFFDKREPFMESGREIQEY